VEHVSTLDREEFRRERHQAAAPARILTPMPC
jgi:hypothetical protein